MKNSDHCPRILVHLSKNSDHSPRKNYECCPCKNKNKLWTATTLEILIIVLKNGERTALYVRIFFFWKILLELWISSPTRSNLLLNPHLENSTKTLNDTSHQAIRRSIMVIGVDDGVRVGAFLLDGFDGTPQGPLTITTIIGIWMEESEPPSSIAFWWSNVIYNSKLRLLYPKLGTIPLPHSPLISDFLTFSGWNDRRSWKVGNVPLKSQ